MKTKIKLLKYTAIVLAVIIGCLFLLGLRPTVSSTLPEETNIVQSISTSSGKAVLYEYESNNGLGLAVINRNFGFLYRLSNLTSDYFDYSPEEPNTPFEALGFGNSEHFLVGVKTVNPEIKYIVVGNHFENLTSSDTYEFSKETVEKHSNSYSIKEVDENYTLFVLDKYSEEAFTIRALDESGRLIADRLLGSQRARNIDW